MKGYRRVQFNMFARPKDLVKKAKGDKVLFPFLWVEEVIQLFSFDVKIPKTKLSFKKASVY